MKKFQLRIVALVLILCSVFGGAAILAESNPTALALQDVVVILDFSSELAEESVDQMKQSVLSFSTSLLHDPAKDSQVAIVSKTSFVSSTGFTTDINHIDNYLNGVKYDQEKNLNDCLQVAVSHFEQDGREESTKKIIVVSEGYFGEYSADVVEQTTVSAVQQYESYVIQVALDEAVATQTSFVLDSIQNKGYSKISDMGELEAQLNASVSEPVAKLDSFSAELQNSANVPIIFLPGMMGSKLYNDPDLQEANRSWDPKILGSSLKEIWNNITRNVGNELGRDSDGNLRTLYVKPPVNQVTAEKREYGALDSYKGIINFLCEEFPDREIYFFSYDCRQGNADSAAKLEDFINNTLKADKVDIVAHSMGGIVASHFVQQGNGSKINKIVTLGTPYEGAPRAFDNSLSYRITNTPLIDAFLSAKGLGKEVKSSFVGVAELTPTENYFKEVSFEYRSASLFSKYTTGNYNDFKRIASTVYGKDVYDGVIRAQNSIYASGDVSILTTLPESYFGVTTNVRTVSAVSVIEGSTIEKTSVGALVYTAQGDGTVPYLSATMMDKVAQSVGASRVKYFQDIDHFDLTSDNISLSWVSDVLNSRISSARSVSVPAPVSAYAVVEVGASPDSIGAKVTNETDDYLSSSSFKSNSENDDAAFGNINVVGEEEEMVQFIDLDDGKYDVELVSKSEGEMDYTVKWYDQYDNLLETRSVSDVPVSVGSVINTNVDVMQDTALYVDQNGNGDVDSVIPLNATIQDVPDTPDGVVSVVGIKLDTPKKSLGLGETKALVAQVFPDNASDKTVTWSSSNPEVVSVDQNGNVTANSSGVATVVALTRDGNYSATCAVTALGEGQLPEDFDEDGNLISLSTLTPRETGTSAIPKTGDFVVVGFIVIGFIVGVALLFTTRKSKKK